MGVKISFGVLSTDLLRLDTRPGNIILSTSYSLSRGRDGVDLLMLFRGSDLVNFLRAEDSAEDFKLLLLLLVLARGPSVVQRIG